MGLLRKAIPCWLEDAENGLRPAFRVLLHGLSEGRPDMASRSRDNYFARPSTTSSTMKNRSWFFGRRPPKEFADLPVHGSIRFSMVLIPNDGHRRNCASRKKKLRNPLLFFRYWTTDFDQIRQIRKNLSAYAKQHDRHVYDRFTVAIDNMHERYGLASRL